MASKKIRVVVRTRPTDRFANDMLLLDHDEKSVHIHIPRRAALTYVNHQQEDWSFKFAKVLHNASQATVYREFAQDIVRQSFDGYNGTIFAYGQTGSGKTFTMTGDTDIYEQRGIIPRSIAQVFQTALESPDVSVNIRISYLEIYNEQLRDLLVNDVAESRPELIVVDSGSKTATVKGLKIKNVFTEEQALALFFEGEANRQIAEHALNTRSSRSHCIFTMYIESQSKVESNPLAKVAKLNFVDLAGSERVAKTAADGTTLKEAAYINRSLSFLEQVVIATADSKRDHVPYRQSKLTYLLKDSIGGNVNALLIANIWSEAEQIEETVSTLRFAQKITCIDNILSVNVREDAEVLDMHDVLADYLTLVKKYQDEVNRLQKELALHDVLAGRKAISYDPFPLARKQEVVAQVRRFIDGSLDEMPIESLRHVTETYTIFRDLIRETEAKVVAQAAQIKLLQNQRKTGIESETAAAKPIETKKDSVIAVGQLDTEGFSVGTASFEAKPSIVAQKKKTRTTRMESVLPPLVPLDDRDSHTPDKDKPDTAFILNFSRLTPAQVYEEYKQVPGKEMNGILMENKAVLKKKKLEARELALEINKTKQIIDNNLAEMKSKCSFFNEDFNISKLEEQVLDEDVYELLLDTNKRKKKYRDLMEQHITLTKQIEQCSQLVTECRKRLVSEFRAWFEAVGGNMDELDSIRLDDPVVERDVQSAPARVNSKTSVTPIPTLREPESESFYGARASVHRRSMVLDKARKSIMFPPAAATGSRRRNIMFQ